MSKAQTIEIEIPIPVGDAIQVLRGAQIPFMRKDAFPVAWKDRDTMQRAFDLYNDHNTPKEGSHRMTVGCAPCHLTVFNWLLDCALGNWVVARPCHAHECLNGKVPGGANCDECAGTGIVTTPAS